MSYRRSRIEKKRLKKLYFNTKNSYGAGAYWDTEKKRYVRYSVHNKWLKTHCRRVSRRRIKAMDPELYNSKIYKKVYDYWWNLL